MTRHLVNRQPLYLERTGHLQDRWVVSYADVVTVLLILFIAIAVEISQSKPLPQPLPAVAPIQRPRDKPEPADPALCAAQIALQNHGITPNMEPRGLVITLPQAILFPAGGNSIGDDALPTIQSVAEVLRDMDNSVLLIGHADSTPIHNRNFHDNWELSAARSIQLMQVLTGQFGLDEARFTVASEGTHSPLDSNDSEEGRARNRRVEIVILDKSRAASTGNDAGL